VGFLERTATTNAMQRMSFTEDGGKRLQRRPVCILHPERLSAKERLGQDRFSFGS
jgi:phage major head subunit gpT-like protein